MSWFPVDDAFHSHPKAIKAGDEACGFWSRAGSFCMAYLTDGFVPEWWVKQQPRGMAKARKLVSAELWTYPAEKDGEQGFQFHDWKHECTKVVVLAAREKARLRKQKSRESQEESHRDGTRDSQVESRRSSGPTQPNPTQPINSLVTSSGGVTEVDARETARPQCNRHPDENSKTSCGDCGRRRAWDEAQEDARKADELAQRRARRDAIDACGLCDQNGKREFGHNRLGNCDHSDVQQEVS